MSRLRDLWRLWDVEVISALLILLGAVCLLSQAGCTTVKSVGGEIGGTAAEWIACPTDLIDCGHVYECAAPADNDIGHVEICIDDDDQPEQLDEIEAAFGHCELTPRHYGLCVYCPEERGCNAFNGCWGCS